MSRVSLSPYVDDLFPSVDYIAEASTHFLQDLHGVHYDPVTGLVDVDLDLPQRSAYGSADEVLPRQVSMDYDPFQGIGTRFCNDDPWSMLNQREWISRLSSPTVHNERYQALEQRMDNSASAIAADYLGGKQKVSPWPNVCSQSSLQRLDVNDHQTPGQISTTPEAGNISQVCPERW
jgi:hypothetical protein